MKTILALPLLAVGLAACDPVPRAPYLPPAYPAAESPYRAIGTEPFWDLEIGRDLVFTDRGNDFAVAEPTPPPIRGRAGTTYSGRRLNVTIVHSRCSDGMSERVYPDTVNLMVDGRHYRGCGAPRALFSQTGEDGLPR